MKSHKGSARSSEEKGMKHIHVTFCHVGGGHPEWHLQTDVTELLKMKWDMVLAFPPCTHLAVSGAWCFKEKQRDGRQQMGIGFFLQFTALDHVPFVAIENPIGIMSNIYRKPDQIIQPYEHGEHARKSTCLWLKNLPMLKPTDIVDPGEILEGGYSVGAGANHVTDENGKILAWNNPMTAKVRSQTYKGIAKAMADQWGDEEVIRRYKAEQDAQIVMDI